MTKQYDILFLDLDGTLIKTLSGRPFPKGIHDMQLQLPVLDAISKIQPKAVVIVTNHGGIEAGFVNESAFCAKVTYISACIAQYCHVKLAVAFYCKTSDKLDPLRKPNTGMFEKAKLWLSKQGVTLHAETTLMVGDASGKPGDFVSDDKDFATNCGIDYLDVQDFIACYE